LSALISPDTHGDGRDEAKQDQVDDLVELVKIREIGVEKFMRPKRRQSAYQDKGADKDISSGVAKIGKQVSFKYSDYCLCIHAAWVI
jgi:hypothetical protein